MSEQKSLLMGKYFKVFKELEEVSKTGKGEITSTRKYNYVELPELISHLKPILAKYGLAFYQSIITNDEKIGVRTVIFDESGTEAVFGELAVSPEYIKAHARTKKNGDQVEPQSFSQMVGIWLTYARRYSLMTAFGLVGEDDTDGEPRGKKTSDAPVSDAEKKEVAELITLAKESATGADGSIIFDVGWLTWVIKSIELKDFREAAKSYVMIANIQATTGRLVLGQPEDKALEDNDAEFLARRLAEVQGGGE